MPVILFISAIVIILGIVLFFIKFAEFAPSQKQMCEIRCEELDMNYHRYTSGNIFKNGECLCKEGLNIEQVIS